MTDPASTEHHDELARRIAAADSVVVLTGAGISVPSGIPDFRSPGTGIWANVDPMTVAHVDVWRSDPVRFWSFYGDRFARFGGLEPNDAHRAVAELERRGHVRTVLTQNIDGLHARAGSGDVVELHGSISGAHCPACGAREPLPAVLRLIAEADDGVPRCGVCAGVLKPDVVLFGDLLPVEALRRAEDLARDADLVLCIGSSLVVWPVAELPRRTLEHGGDVAVVTTSDTPYDDDAVVRLRGDVVAELDGLLAALDRLAD
ncbi:SIR2 family NAD-dependent protein deacylase [Patulibacter minatonensis]|uniref:SIR2 family NAD-dependent protein deacylase n=1 Tax=Patulibacter minatonensis TaxID=298163 RepID=UPI0004BCADF7|nr:NAD-dependent deacylase [Patulibacter minatonensis]